MNEKQKMVLIVAACFVVAMLLYPPFHIIWTEGRVVGTGYSWIFNPPEYATVDSGLLLMQWLAVLMVGAMAYLFFKDSR